MDEHPGIVFRGGPAGRRAALPTGPDVWEVIASLKESKTRGQGAITETAGHLGLSEPQVRVALGYYGVYPDEIDERIRANIEQADAAEAAWRREQAALA